MWQLRSEELKMIAAIYARKSTEQYGVADEQKSVANCRWAAGSEQNRGERSRGQGRGL